MAGLPNQHMLRAAFIAALSLTFSLTVRADEQLLIQQQRQKALEQQLTPAAPDVRLNEAAESTAKLVFPAERPCFLIRQVQLHGAEALPHWLPLQRLADQAVGHCLGTNGIDRLMRVLQNRLISHGYVTSRVLAPGQNLRSGALALTVVPGYLRAVTLTPDSGRWLHTASAFPPRPGRLLDLRDIEQGLENLQRLPTVEASMEILPGDQPGESDIALHWRQRKMWRVNLSLDDSGTRSTGRYQGGVTLSLDNPLALSDLFYVSLTHDLQRGSEKGSRNYTGHYSLPFGYNQLAVTASDYTYHQTVAGVTEDYRYSGESRNLAVQLSRVLHRNGQQKTTLTYAVKTRQSRNKINDTEVEVQRRHTSAWQIGLDHRHFIGPATLDAGVQYQRGTRWFGAQPAPEEEFAEGTALSRILQLNAQFDLPFLLGGQQFRYHLDYQRQLSETALTAQDQFAIGNRWTVRGFDGERTLNADNGWLVRNDLSWLLPGTRQALYLGVDYGEVSGRGTEWLPGAHLAGGVIGLRGTLLNTDYDLLAGTPFERPDGFRTSSLTLGFNLNWHY